jgi:hypothetical protein
MATPRKPQTSRATRDLADELNRLDQRVRNLAKPQLAHSAIEGGAIEGYDPITGNLTSIIGEQFDGSHGAYPVTGPVPAAPAAFLVIPGLESLTVRWDGVFGNVYGDPDITITPTMDHARVEIHVSEDPAFEPITADTLKGTIESPRGGELVIQPLEAKTADGQPRTYYVRLVTRTLAGKSSPPSPVASGTPFAPSQIVLDEIDAAQTVIRNAGDIMVGEGEGTALGEQLEMTSQDIQGLTGRLDNEILPAIDEAAASPITDSRLQAGSLSVWPFTPDAIPPGTIGGTELADFSILVTKLNTNRHHLY